MIRIAIIEDNRLLREGLALKLNEQEDCTVAHASASGSLDEIRAAAADVLLLDVGLESEDSLAFAQGLRAELPTTRVIVMDLLPVHEDLVEFVTAGVAGFIVKDATLEEFLATIRSVARGDTILPPAMASTLFSQIIEEATLRGPAEVSEATDLTVRERKVVSLIGEGLSNKAIARMLGISPHTVKSHVRNIMDKLALHSRLQIAAHMHRSADEAADE
jgi:DNA-binding NarL/FixJ family response regulator